MERFVFVGLFKVLSCENDERACVIYRHRPAVTSSRCCTSRSSFVWGTSCLHCWRVCVCVHCRGIFYQGYYCSRCGTGAHKECLEVITICKISTFSSSNSNKYCLFVELLIFFFCRVVHFGAVWLWFHAINGVIVTPAPLIHCVFH